MNNEEEIEILKIAYGSKTISLNKGENHIILDKDEVSFMIKSFLNNSNIVEIKIN